MKTELHPTYYPKAKIHCACGKVYDIGDTKADVRVEICANCHPFYTGEEKLIDTAGRVEKFKTRKAKAEATPKIVKKPKVKKEKK